MAVDGLEWVVDLKQKLAERFRFAAKPWNQLVLPDVYH